MGNWKLVDTGGTERDLETYYYFQVEQVNGGSAPPVEVFGTPYAVLPGEVADGERVAARDVFLTGTIYGTSITTLNQRKTALFDAIKHWRTGQTDRNSDPILLRYTGSQRTVELQCKYVGGYEGGYDWQGGTSERLALHFRAQEDPTWRATSNTTLTLDPTDSGTSRYVIGKVGGVWNLWGHPRRRREPLIPGARHGAHVAGFPYFNNNGTRLPPKHGGGRLGKAAPEGRDWLFGLSGRKGPDLWVAFRTGALTAPRLRVLC